MRDSVREESGQQRLDESRQLEPSLTVVGHRRRPNEQRQDEETHTVISFSCGFNVRECVPVLIEWIFMRTTGQLVGINPKREGWPLCTYSRKKANTQTGGDIRHAIKNIVVVSPFAC